MKRFSLYIVLLLAGLIFIGAPASAQDKMKKETIAMAPEDMKWVEIEGSHGAMTATFWGDPNKGGYGGMVKFPAGYKAPLHSHTSDIKMEIIKGGYIYNGKTYGPGSYLFIPGGDKHTSAGVDDSETIFFIEQPGKFDLKPVEEAKQK
jgi:hypothetical protein